MVQDVRPLPGFREPYGLLCAILQDGTNEWRSELAWFESREEMDAAFGPELMVRRVRPEGQSLGAILLHIIGVELFWIEEFALGRQPSAEDVADLMLGQIDVDAGVWPDPPVQPLSYYFDLQDRYRLRSLEAVRQWAEPETQIDLHGSPRSLRWVLGHVIQHESYHGGQAVLLHDLLRAGTV